MKAGAADTISQSLSPLLSSPRLSSPLPSSPLLSSPLDLTWNRQRAEEVSRRAPSLQTSDQAGRKRSSD